jgi:hypothetical protein
MSLVCTSADITTFIPIIDRYDDCIAATPDDPYFPTGKSVKTCMEALDVSTECAQCWGNVYDDFKSCFFDTCEFSLDTPIDTQLVQTCIDCLINFREAYYNDNHMCDVLIADLPTGSGEMIAAQTLKWTINLTTFTTTSSSTSEMTTTSDSTTLKTKSGSIFRRSVIITAFVFVILIIS